jgi:hypothetical protein
LTVPLNIFPKGLFLLAKSTLYTAASRTITILLFIQNLLAVYAEAVYVLQVAQSIAVLSLVHLLWERVLPNQSAPSGGLNIKS